MSGALLSTSTRSLSLSSSSPFFLPTSQTPTIQLVHHEHLVDDERAPCNVPRQSGSMTPMPSPHKMKCLTSEHGCKTDKRNLYGRPLAGLLWERRRNAKLKEKHKWSDEQPQLDNARRLRGIYFIDPEDKEFRETIQNARKKLENSNGSCHALQDKQEKQAW